MSRTGFKVPRIRRYRQRKGLTQSQLAGILDIDRCTLARLESPNCRRSVGRTVATKIARILGTTPGSVIDEYERRRSA